MLECPVTKASEYQPFLPDNLRCPQAGWKLMRDEAPVYRADIPSAKMPVYFVTRREDIDYISRHTELFSNEPSPSVWRWGEFDDQDIARAFADTGRKVVFTLQTTDPPRSQMYRKVLTDAVGPSQIKAWRPEIDAIIRNLIDAIPDGEPVNFVDAFSVPLPLQVICLILGIPYAEADFFRFYSDEFTHLVDPTHSSERAVKATETVVIGYKRIEEWLKQYQETPADNLLSAFANARYEDGRLTTMDEALSMAHTTVIAGNETTRNALSSAMLTLCRHPEVWARLKDDRSKVSGFVEEVLRRDAPAITTPRMVLQDCELGGVSLKKGDCLFVIWASGSQDERTFADPLTFDLDRKNKSAHTTFGLGIHFCAGSSLARAELIQAVNLWLDTFRTVELAVPNDEVQYDAVFGFHSLTNLPVRLTR